MRISDWSSDVCSSDLRAGVKIYEYCERPMHAKGALIDDDWTTVGSSNLDPLSLFLNLEANLVVRDAPLADTLRRSVQDLMDHHCRAIQPQEARKRTLVRQILSYVAYHITRRLPSIAGWMPAHAPTRHTLPAVAESDPESDKH